MLPADPELAGQRAGEVAPRERAEVEPGEAEQQLVRAPARRQQGGEAVGLDVADLAGRARRSPPAATACRRSGTVPRTSPRVFSEGKARRMPSNESGSSATSVARPRVSNRVSRWTSPTATLAGRSPSRCRAVPWKVTLRSGPSSVPVAASRPSRITAGAMRRTVRRSTSELRTSKPVKTSPSSAPRARRRLRRRWWSPGCPAPARRRTPSRSARRCASRKPEPATVPGERAEEGQACRRTAGPRRGRGPGAGAACRGSRARGAGR